jgi:hypothetical protein
MTDTFALSMYAGRGAVHQLEKAGLREVQRLATRELRRLPDREPAPPGFQQIDR